VTAQPRHTKPQTGAGVTLVLTEDLHGELVQAAAEHREIAGVLLCASALTDTGGRLIGTRIRWVPPEAYLRQEQDGLTVTSGGYVPALGEAETEGLIPLWLHTHPSGGATPIPSVHDERVDDELENPFRIRSGASHYGALVVSPRADTVSFTGHIRDERTRRPISRLVVLGDALSTRASYPHDEQGSFGDGNLFSRNVRAFGGPIQEALSQLAVGVIGCGGTGSAVAEQLVRLGVRHLTIVDPDELEASNITRVYGSTPTEVGRPKTRVLAAHLSRIAPDAEISPVVGTVNDQAVARALVDRDVLFGCTDDNAGRIVLSRLAIFLRILVIDCGILISSNDDGGLQGIDARVTIMKPGSACLICRGRIDIPRAAAEQMAGEEQQRLAAEGYAPALPGVQPAVVAYTTMVAAQAVAELIELLTGYGPSPRPTEILLRAHDREISTNIAIPRPGHFCDPTQGHGGAGVTVPFLDKLWAQ
jgi:molybdopterin/thiamine biosynthesis adenylyltransferase